MWIVKTNDDSKHDDEPLWLVGFYNPEGYFELLECFPYTSDGKLRAMMAVHYLNGGDREIIIESESI